MDKKIFVFNHGPHKSSIMLKEMFGISREYDLFSPRWLRPCTTVIWGWLYHVWKLRRYDLLFLEGFHLIFLVPLLGKKTKVIIKGNDQTIYYINNSRFRRVFFIRIIKRIVEKKKVGIIAVSEMMKQRYQQYFNIRTEVAEGFMIRGYEQLSRISPNLSSRNIISIGKNSEFKGVDRGVKVFLILKKRRILPPEAEYFLIGGHKEYVCRKSGMPGSELERMGVRFIGVTGDIEKYIAKSAFQFHLARFEPNAVAVMEGMSAGLIPIVSQDTGNKTFIENIDGRLIVEYTTPERAADDIEKIFAYYDDRTIERFSKEFKNRARHYSMENGLLRWRACWENLTEGPQ